MLREYLYTIYSVLESFKEFGMKCKKCPDGICEVEFDVLLIVNELEELVLFVVSVPLLDTTREPLPVNVAAVELLL